VNKKGFTLIELMIVVVIIGILAAIAIPNFISMQDRAKEAQVKSQAHSVQLAAEDHAVRNDGIYSVDIADIEALLPGGDPLENAFDPAEENPVGAAASGPGEVGIVAGPDGAAFGYIITGFGKDGDAGPDEDGLATWQEYLADTDPTNPASFYPRLEATILPGSLWMSIDPTSTGRQYHLDSATNLVNSPGWSNLTNAPGTGGAWTSAFVPSGTGTYYFRSRVTLPSP